MLTKSEMEDKIEMGDDNNKNVNSDTPLSKIIASDLPKGTALLADLTSNLSNVTASVLALKEKIKNGDINTSKGLSLLELKNQSFLMYMANLAYITLRKLKGKPLENDPSIDRLVEMRVVLERLRPLEDKLKYQIDKFVKIATEGMLAEDDPSRLKGNLDNIGSSSDEEEEVKQKTTTMDKPIDEDATYKIPKISQTPYDEDNDKEKRKEEARKRVLNSSMLRDALYEHTEDPEVVYNMDTLKRKAVEKRKKLDEYEEDNMLRKSLTKRERASMNEVTTLGTMGKEILGFNNMDALHEDFDPDESTAKRQKTSKDKTSMKGTSGKKGKVRGKKVKGKKGKKKRNFK